MLRGLIVRQEHAGKFFDVDGIGNKKTMELRNHNLRCVKPDEKFYIVECGHGRNLTGDLVMRVRGSVTFVANVQLSPGAVPGLRDQHLCSDEEFQQIQKKWKKKDNVVGWKVKNAELLPGGGKWMKPHSQAGMS